MKGILLFLSLCHCSGSAECRRSSTDNVLETLAGTLPTVFLDLRLDFLATHVTELMKFFRDIESPLPRFLTTAGDSSLPPANT